jgi:uncharacterized protein (TIRG00374 family)
VKKNLLWGAVKYGIGFALLGYVIWKYWTPAPGSDEPGLADLLQRPVQTGPLALATIICLASILLTFVRWYVLVHAQKLPFSMGDAMRLGMVGYFFSTFLPGSIGGDIIKAAFLAREQSRRTVAVATVLLDRAIGLWGLVCLVALMGVIFWASGDPAVMRQADLKSIIGMAVAIVAASVAVWKLLGVLPAHRAERFAGRLGRIPKVGHSAAEFWRALWMYRCQRGHVALALLLAMIGHVGFVLTFYFAAQIFQPAGASGEIPTLAEHFLIVPIGMCAQALIPTPGGVGVGEAAFGGLYKMIGKPFANGVLGSLGQRVITWGLSFSGYLLYLRMRPAQSSRKTSTPWGSTPQGAFDRPLVCGQSD